MTDTPRGFHDPSPFDKHPGAVLQLLPCRAFCTKVIDGDTYDLLIEVPPHLQRTERVRLYGYDTPEVYGRNASAEGRLAKARVEELILHQPLMFHWLVQESTFGRMVGIVYFLRDDSWFNLGEALEAEGLATARIGGYE